MKMEVKFKCNTSNDTKANFSINTHCNRGINAT